MDLGLLLKAYLMALVQSKWAAFLDGLRKAKFAVQDPTTKEWFVKYSIGNGASPEVFGDATAAFLRKVMALVKAATK